MAALLPRRGALPAADLMKVQGHVVQMANIHQSNNTSDDGQRRVIHGAEGCRLVSPSVLAVKTFVIKTTFGSLHKYIYSILLYVPVYVSLAINRYQLDSKTLIK